MDRLVDSIRINGFWKHRPITLSRKSDGTLVVIAGNQRLKAAKKLKLEQVPVVIYYDLTDEEEAEIVIRDNINNGEWHVSMLENDWGSIIDFDFVGLDLPVFDKPEKSKEKKGKSKSDPDDGFSTSEEDPDNDVVFVDDKEEFYRSMLNDVLYESNNEFEIPNLLLDKQAGKLELPFAPWGADSRLRKDVSTYHFYVDDYRFEAIWKDPIKVLTSGVKALVEPNLSVFDTTPISFGLHQIYKKRWISRYFQECGILVYADLNVSAKFKEYNRMGIPDGYNAFFTRGYSDRVEYLKMELDVAREISGLQTPNLLVYGGGDEIRKFCVKNSLIYIEQFINNKK